MVQSSLVIAIDRRFVNLSVNHVFVQFLTANGTTHTSTSTRAMVSRLGLID